MAGFGARNASDACSNYGLVTGGDAAEIGVFLQGDTAVIFETVDHGVRDEALRNTGHFE